MCVSPLPIVPATGILLASAEAIVSLTAVLAAFPASVFANSMIRVVVIIRI